MSKTFRVAFEPKQENKWNYEASYVFHEFPKWVTLADGEQILVHNAEEENAAIGQAPADSGADRDQLMAEAKALGLNPHHKTGADKLQQLINEAKGA